MSDELRSTLSTVKASTVTVALVAAWFAFPSGAMAYSTQNHKTVTIAAVDVFNACVDRGYPGHLITPAEEEALVDYNLGQDGLLRKMILWHFPSGNPEPHKSVARFYYRFGVVLTTFDPWVAHLEKNAPPESPPDELYPALGAILHFVQDMAIPAHAVPIFHPSGWAQIRPDKFDSYEGDNFPAAIENPELPGLCGGISRHTSIQSLLAHTRSETLAAVAGKWSRVWPAEEVSANGFGRYGCSKDKFGKTPLVCDELTFSKAESKTLVQKQADLALRSSVQAIGLLQKHLAKCVVGSCDPPKRDKRWLPTRKMLTKIKAEIEARGLNDPKLP